MRSLLLIVFLGMSSLTVPAWAIYKCQSGDQVTYRDAPCEGTAATSRLPTTPTPSSNPDAQKRLNEQKKELNSLRKERERREAVDEKERQRIARTRQTQQKKCAELAMRAQWAKEDAAKANIRSADRLQRQARRATEKHALHCPA